MTESTVNAKLRILTRIILYGLLICISMTAVTFYVTLSIKRDYESSKTEEYVISGYHTMMRELELEYWKCKYDIVTEVDSYICRIAINHNLSALELLNCCDKYQIDVRLALSQGKVESHFGTQGLASKTNSVWNYLAYDGYKLSDIPKPGQYTHPNLSIEPYLRLIRDSYLGDQKVERDLLENFVNLSGNRYASSELYEQELKIVWNEIDSTTSLDSLLSRYRHLKVELGR